MTDSDTPDALFIAGLGTFQAQRDDGFLGLYCFRKDHTFKSQTVELVVYPNDDGTWPSESQRRELTLRFMKFEEVVDSALQQLPAQLKPLCKQYQIDVDHLTPLQFTTGFNWHNVKLEPNGDIECYTMNKSVTDNLDIVIRFSPPATISQVYFDG